MTSVLAFIVVIGILIVIHELGHFVVARLTGVGVERFSIGFGPVLWRYRGPETEYCLSAIPMGGYVKMMGDDENPLEGGAGPSVDPARAFNGKPLMARFLIVFAGPGMNFVLAAVIFALVYMIVGRPTLPAVVGGVVAEGAAAKAGLAPGDRIRALDGQPVEYWDEIARLVRDGQGKSFDLTITGPTGAERRLTIAPTRVMEKDVFGDEREVWDLGIIPHVAATIGDAVAGYPAAQAGLRSGDTVLSIEGRPVVTWSDLADTISKRADQPTRLEVRRGSDTLTVTLTPKAVKDRGLDGKETTVGRIGISPQPATTYVRSNPVAAIRDGVEKTAEVTTLTAVGLWKIVVGQLDRSNIGGPIQIAQAAGEQARHGLPSLAFFTAVISVNLALLNLLPVPMLDGGHLLFFVCEAVLGRPLSVRKREVAQQVGFVLLLMLMVFAVYNDLVRIDVLRFFR
ncbi:MAG TPA: RIP metalloprotease RseP [Verrucomicrobiae bacterium]|jgi:regulator of sigma E protease|nr:RIP metalloprotease RseP [Verrucomicrobiae bacterium]